MNCWLWQQVTHVLLKEGIVRGWIWPSAYDGYNDNHLDNDNEDSEGHDENDANQKSNVILKAEAIKPRPAALTIDIAKSTADPTVERSYRSKYRTTQCKIEFTYKSYCKNVTPRRMLKKILPDI